MLKSGRDYSQQTRDDLLRDDLSQLVRLAIREDLGRGFDLTTVSVVPQGLDSSAAIIARVNGRAAGIELIEWIVETIGAPVRVETYVKDGEPFCAKQTLATLFGDARDLLTCERTILNFLGRLCGIATLTSRYVDAVAGSKARLYDTRKTTPGWRRLEKYAVSCGGGRNHRLGLQDAILIKDNHLAAHQKLTGRLLSPAIAIEEARQFLMDQPDIPSDTIVEIEVDSLDQLRDALTAEPDIVLLDNMSNSLLQSAVALRDAMAPRVQLEASGGINLTTIASVAKTGVDRISVGALTHSATNLDLGLDWVLGIPNK